MGVWSGLSAPREPVGSGMGACGWPGRRVGLRRPGLLTVLAWLLQMLCSRISDPGGGRPFEPHRGVDEWSNGKNDLKLNDFR